MLWRHELQTLLCSSLEGHFINHVPLFMLIGLRVIDLFDFLAHIITQ